MRSESHITPTHGQFNLLMEAVCEMKNQIKSLKGSNEELKSMIKFLIDERTNDQTLKVPMPLPIKKKEDEFQKLVLQKGQNFLFKKLRRKHK